MSFQLNPSPKNYKDFYGRNVDQMPKLIAEGRTPLSVAGLMEVRLKYGKELRDWMNNYFDTGDGVIYHPDGRIKIVHDSQLIRELSPKSPLKNSALVLEDGVYGSVQGQEFKKSDFEKYTGKKLSAKAVKKNPLWQALARGDQNLLNEYTNFIFSEAKENFKYDKNMGIYLDSAGDTPKLRAWCVNRLDYRSDADGGFNLVDDLGRFVGVSTEGAVETKK
ncbi:MAG: hypothetical protein AABW50_03955 [Nanoarchaeota archaeon]